jgi:O-antigen/teichoic acid export membrane protein
MVDQVLSSGAQLLVTVLVARQADPATFGAFSIAMLVHGFLLGTMRAAIGEVVLLRCRADPSAARHEASRGLFLSLLAGVVTGTAMLVSSAVISGQVGHYLLMVGLTAPIVYAQDVLRYVGYGVAKVGLPIIIDGLWLAVQVAVSVLLVSQGTATPGRFLLAWALGAAVGALVGAHLLRVRPHPVAFARWWSEERTRAAGFMTDFLVSNGAFQATFLLLSFVMPLEELAALRVALLSVSPLGNLLAGVRALVLAHLSGLQDQPARAHRRAVQVSLGLGGAAAAYGIGLVLLPDSWASELFGDTWSEAVPLVGIIAAGEVLRLSAFAAIDLVKVLGAPRDLVRTRMRAVGGVVVGMVLGALLAGPKGAATGAAVGYVWNQAIWWIEARAVSRRRAVDQRETVRA